MLSFYEGVGVGLLKIQESESELLCTDSTALVVSKKLNRNILSVSSTKVTSGILRCTIKNTTTREEPK
jgi:hypothetical protein